MATQNPFVDYKQWNAARQAIVQSEQDAAMLRQILQTVNTAPLNSAGQPLRPGAPAWQAFGNVGTQSVGRPATLPLDTELASREALQNALRKTTHSQVIARGAESLFSPFTGNKMPVPSPAISGPYTPPAAPKSALGPIMLLIDLLTKAPELNKGEQQKLDAIHGKRKSNVPPAPEPDQVMLEQISRALSTGGF